MSTTHEPPGAPPTAPPPRRTAYWVLPVFMGLVVGWVIGLTIRPGPTDLRDTTLALVPASATITETSAKWGHPWVIVPAPPPLHHVRIQAPLTLDDMVADLVATAQQAGWTITTTDEWANAIVMTISHPTHHGRMSARIDGARDEIIDRPGAISVVRNEGVERGIVIPASLIGGLAGGLLALIAYGPLGITPRHRWPHTALGWVGAALLTFLWYIATGYLN